mmetsp:Transcript_513/g.302  ORF Transcript_513/g.302 Transcript_513/m.302 type:complete len:205 (-) Transcript_513:134-748(-)
MIILFSNRCYVYLVIASFFRFFGGYTLGFLGSKYFIGNYPNNTSEYAWQNAFVIIGGGVPASMIAGELADRFEGRRPHFKSYISGVGALLATPFIMITFFWQPSYYGCITSYYFAYLIAEMWYGPAHALINNLFPSQMQGISIAIFNIAGTISGSIAIACLSSLAESYNAKEHPERYGYIVGSGVLFSYFMCAPFFILAGNTYA